MTAEAWVAELATALRRENVDRWHLDQFVGEAAAHLAESGEDPLAAFGEPGDYARRLAGELGAPPGPHASPEPRLQVTGVTRRHRGRVVLHDLHLQAGAGEVVAVVGANGAGKSTLLRICAGLEVPDAGTVTVTGSLGYCPQQPALVDHLTAGEHFELVGAGRGLDRAGARAEGDALAAALGWSPGPETVGRLSGGTRQKLNVALAALGRPDVLLLDEPYQGFDGEAYLDFWEQVWHWRDSGVAVVVVTHRAEHLKRVDSVVELRTDRQPAVAGAGRRGGR